MTDRLSELRERLAKAIAADEAGWLLDGDEPALLDAHLNVVELAQQCVPYISDTDGSDPGLALESALARLNEGAG